MENTRTAKTEEEAFDDSKSPWNWSDRMGNFKAVKAQRPFQVFGAI